MTITGNHPSDIVLATLKARYFEILRKEEYPRTPAITAEADQLEAAIRAQMEKTNP